MCLGRATGGRLDLADQMCLNGQGPSGNPKRGCGVFVMTFPPALSSAEDALNHRHGLWQNSPYVPDWVDLNSVDLEQFFTRADVAKDCHSSLISWMESDGADSKDYTFIEPSAGTGSFFDLLPREKRIGVDIMPFREEYAHADFLTWEPPTDHRVAVVGNPPFGYRAWLALAFMNHAATFADYVGFILPMAFQSDGKGSPKHRVRGLRLIHSEPLPAGAFVDVNGRPKKINALWQVWQRGVNHVSPEPSCTAWVDLFTIDSRAERRCGHEREHEADFFLQRTFFGDAPSLVTCFEDVRYGCGYGIVIKQDREAVLSVLRHTNWSDYSNLAAHNCRHISMYHIRRALTDAGLRDD